MGGAEVDTGKHGSIDGSIDTCPLYMEPRRAILTVCGVSVTSVGEKDSRGEGFYWSTFYKVLLTE